MNHVLQAETGEFIFQGADVLMRISETVNSTNDIPIALKKEIIEAIYESIVQLIDNYLNDTITKLLLSDDLEPYRDIINNIITSNITSWLS